MLYKVWDIYNTLKNTAECGLYSEPEPATVNFRLLHCYLESKNIAAFLGRK